MSDEQEGVRRRFTAQEKVAILREHLVEKVPVSEVCDKHGLNPTVFYRWQKEFFENGAAAFEARQPRADGKTRQLEQRVEALKANGIIRPPGRRSALRPRLSEGRATSPEPAEM